MVSKASEDLPEPERPVITISRLRGSVRSTFLRLCSRAPLMTIASSPRGAPFSERVTLGRHAGDARRFIFGGAPMRQVLAHGEQRSEAEPRPHDQRVDERAG